MLKYGIILSIDGLLPVSLTMYIFQEETMALSDNPAAKKRSPKKRALSTGSNHSWSDKQKIEAVQSWLLLGNLALTSRVLGIPEITLRVWKTTEWWKNTVDDIKLQENMQMSARLKKIVDASLGAVEDRIVNGDFMFDQKSGEMVRKQVNLRDAHKVAVDLLDKRAMLDKAAAPQQEEKQDEDRLLKLAEKFAEFVTKKKDPLIIDAEDVEVKIEENKNDISGNSISGDAESVKNTQDMSSMSDNVLAEIRRS